MSRRGGFAVTGGIRRPLSHEPVARAETNWLLFNRARRGDLARLISRLEQRPGYRFARLTQKEMEAFGGAVVGPEGREHWDWGAFAFFEAKDRLLDEIHTPIVIVWCHEWLRAHADHLARPLHTALAALAPINPGRAIALGELLQAAGINMESCQ